MTHKAISTPIPGSDPDLTSAWDEIHVPEDLKTLFQCSAMLSLTLRTGRWDPTATPVSGFQLLSGPPGTGKTTLARALAGRLHLHLADRMGPVTMIELNTHELSSDLLGQSQRSVASVLEEHIPALASEGPTVLVVDELETLAFDRREANTEANPVDVHKATDAVLSGFDRVSRECPLLLIAGTTNHQLTVDQALVSRADQVLTFELPDLEAVEHILRSTITSLAEQRGAAKGSALAGLASDKRLRAVAERLVGRDGRVVRKFVISALAGSAELALAPERLTLDDLHARLDRDQAQEERLSDAA